MSGRRAGPRRWAAVCCIAQILVYGGVAVADDMSGADKLRVIWSNQMSWTPAGIPIVTVGLLDGRDEVRVEGEAGLRVLPDGDGGVEIRGGKAWTVRALDTKPSVIKWHIVVATGLATDAERLSREAARFRDKGLAPHTFEVGTVIGLRGEVIDMRHLMVAVDPQDSIQKAKQRAAEIAEEFHVETGLHAVVMERPRGVLEARDESGAVVRNESVLWFAPASREQGPGSRAASDSGEGTLSLPDVPRAQGGVERRHYAGKLYVTIGSDGKLAAANALPEDRLLAGLLPAEMGASAPPEALKAQAVAARNELLARLGTRHLTDPYRLCSKVHCQVYAGASHEDPRAAAAIEATRGELIVRPDGTLVDAVYSATCGGHTEDNDKAWGTSPDPALRGVVDVDEKLAPALAAFARVDDPAKFLGALPAPPACAAASNFRWVATVAAKAVEQKIGLGPLREIAVLDRGVSGRATRLQIVADGGTKEIKSELEIRRLFGNLKSSLFTFTVERDESGHLRALHFSGGGHGHGVGMCQSGAAQLAATHGYKAILNHYYTGTHVKRFY